jgi:MFS family permease
VTAGDLADTLVDPPPGRMRRTAQRTFLSLRHRNFRLYFFGQLVSNTGNWLTQIALTLLVLHLTDSGLAVGALTVASFGPILLLSPTAGAIADRSDKRKLLMVTQVVAMTESAALAVLAFMPDPPLALLYVVATVGGMALAFDNPLRRSFVTEMVPYEDRPNAVALNSALVNTSRIFGPALAGLLVVTVGFGWCFALDAGSYVFVLIALVMMRPSELHRVINAGKAKGAIRTAVRYIRQTPRLRIAFVMLMVIGTLGYNLGVTLPLFVQRSLHGGDAEYTILYALFSLGALISSLIVAHRQLVHLRNVVIGATAFGTSLLLLALMPTLAAAVPMALVLGISTILYFTATTAIVQVDADPKFHGRILALQTVLLIGTAPIGGPIDGALADAFGARVPLILGGAATLAAALWGWLAARRTGAFHLGERDQLADR